MRGQSKWGFTEDEDIDDYLQVLGCFANLGMAVIERKNIWLGSRGFSNKEMGLLEFLRGRSLKPKC